MLLRTLGRLELEGASFHRPKPLLLLAFLALEGAQERSYLADLFFPGNANARANLSTTLSRLRSAIPDVIEATDGHVSSHIETDFIQLLSLIDEGDRQKALRLYQGRFLSGVNSTELGVELEEWLYSTREAIASQVQGVQLSLAEQAAASGNYHKAAELALSAYRLAESTAAPELLRRMHTLLLAGGSTAAVMLREELEDFSVKIFQSQDEAQEQLRNVFGAKPTATPHNLSLRGTSFVGRDVELAEIALQLLEHRLVTLVGAGGVGKTRLALQVAEQQLREGVYSDGVYFVELGALNSSQAIPSSIAAALGMTLHGNEDGTEQLARSLADRHMLIVFDNFEHVMDGVVIVSRLLRDCPLLKVLVTSRERLNLEEEWYYKVTGLSYPRSLTTISDEVQHVDSVQLFCQRAKQAKPGFCLDGESLPAVICICQLVEGMPLALELSASWLRVMPCEEIMAALASDLDLLTTAKRDVAAKHRSIRACFSYSWRLLSAKEKQVLRELAAFRGGFRRDAATTVTGASLFTLAALVDKSLLRVSESGRYDRHTLLYQFTQEKLAGQPDEKQVKARHARYYLHFTEKAVAQLSSAEQVKWRSRVAEEHENILTALEHLFKQQESTLSLRLAVAASHYWGRIGFYEEGCSYLVKALAFPDVDQALRASALMRAGTLRSQQGRTVEAWTFFEEGLRLSRELGDKRGLSAGLDNLGNIAAGQGDYKRARALLEESLTLRREIKLSGAIAWSLIHLSGVERLEGHSGQARAMLDEALTLTREEDDYFSEAWVLDGFGWLEYQQTHYGEAQYYFKWALELRSELDDDEGTRVSHANLARLAQAQGHLDLAQQHYQHSLALSREYTIESAIADNLYHLGEIALRQNQLVKAEAYLKECLSLRQRLQDTIGIRKIVHTLFCYTVNHNAEFAAKLGGMLEALEGSSTVRQRDTLKASLSDEVLDDNWHEGKRLRLEQIIPLTFKRLMHYAG